MDLFVPYTFRHGPTWAALEGLGADGVLLEGPNDYLEYFRIRWDVGRGFINVEHDVVAPTGAVEALAECPWPWCWHPYADVDPEQYPNLGLTKFSEVFILATPCMWDDFDSDSGVMRQRWQRRPTWSMLDGWIAGYGAARGLLPHRHNPPVTNGRPDGVEQQRDDSMAGFLHG